MEVNGHPWGEGCQENPGRQGLAGQAEEGRDSRQALPGCILIQRNVCATEGTDCL